MSYNIYLVEDEKNLNDILSYYIKKEGWNVTSFSDGLHAQKEITNTPDLWVLDIMIPGIDGIQLLKEIKEYSPHIPVIFMSARNSDMDKIMGLELGSDDYLAKPFLPRELIIRIQRILQRTMYSTLPLNSNLKNIDGYTINTANRIALENTTPIDLTSKEFDMLLLFINSKGQALSRNTILNQVWGDDYFGSDRVVDNLIKRLRKKMPQLNIETIYGFGYRRL